MDIGVVSRSMSKFEEIGDVLERMLVEEISERAERAGYSQAAFARLAFGENGTSVGRWAKIRGGTGGGKPQSLRVFEAFAAATALNLSLNEIVYKVEREYHLTTQQD
jgi:hypothetical protein